MTPPLVDSLVNKQTFLQKFISRVKIWLKPTFTIKNHLLQHIWNIFIIGDQNTESKPPFLQGIFIEIYNVCKSYKFSVNLINFLLNEKRSVAACISKLFTLAWLYSFRSLPDTIPRTAIMSIIFWGFLMVEQIFLWPKMKWSVIISNKLVYTSSLTSYGKT